jgi:hypothetical protein
MRQTLSPPAGTFRVPVGDGGYVVAGPHPVIAPGGIEARVALLIERGVRHFVDLSSHEDWMPGYLDLLSAECEYSRYEIVDRRLPEDSPALKVLLRRIIAEAREGRVAYFHCQAGVGRTGTVVAVMLRELGLSGEAALEELVRLRALARLHEGSPEFEAQREFVRQWIV